MRSSGLRCEYEYESERVPSKLDFANSSLVSRSHALISSWLRVPARQTSRACESRRGPGGPRNSQSAWLSTCAPCGRHLRQDLDVPVRSIHADPLSIPDQPGGMLNAQHG